MGIHALTTWWAQYDRNQRSGISHRTCTKQTSLSVLIRELYNNAVKAQRCRSVNTVVVCSTLMAFSVMLHVQRLLRYIQGTNFTAFLQRLHRSSCHCELTEKAQWTLMKGLKNAVNLQQELRRIESQNVRRNSMGMHWLPWECRDISIITKI